MTKPDLQVSAPRVLFDSIPYSLGDYYTEPNWDISPDGKYFVMIRAEQGGASGASNIDANRLKLITNFFTELRQRVARR
jgi:Tol biopolymer transport system component